MILNTQNYEACVAFYRDTLSLPVMFEKRDGDFQLTCLDFGGTYLMILVLTPLAFALSFNVYMGRADHHGFLALLFMVQLCTAFRMSAGYAGKHAALLNKALGRRN